MIYISNIFNRTGSKQLYYWNTGNITDIHYHLFSEWLLLYGVLEPLALLSLRGILLLWTIRRRFEQLFYLFIDLLEFGYKAWIRFYWHKNTGYKDVDGGGGSLHIGLAAIAGVRCPQPDICGNKLVSYLQWLYSCFPIFWRW